MVSPFKPHPFAVEAYFERSIVLGFALPTRDLESLIPPSLRLATFGDEWGFLAVAMVQTKNLRPAGFPRWLGRDFSLIGYRVFVRYQSASGKELHGLYILRSETDRWTMKFGGNIFTRYNYQLTDVSWDVDPPEIGIRSTRSDLDVRVVEIESEPSLPSDSPFGSWKEARRFAGPMPYTFSVNPDGKEIVIIKGVRSNWHPRPLEVTRSRVGFLDHMNMAAARLANAFVVSDVPYRWEKGRFEELPPATAQR